MVKARANCAGLLAVSEAAGAVLRSAAEGGVLPVQPEALFESALRLPHGTND
jgi:hypothetical protein